MRTIELRDSFGINNLRLGERSQPSPIAGEVLVKIEAVSLNYVDLLVVKGLLNPNLSLLYIPVCDGAGVVVEVGEGVTAFESGDKVVTTFIPNWLSGKPTQQTTEYSIRPGLGGVPGQLSEYKCFHINQLIQCPTNLSTIEASTLPIAGLTAWNALQYANLQAGETVLLHGTGGVSIFALQFALSLVLADFVEMMKSSLCLSQCCSSTVQDTRTIGALWNSLQQGAKVSAYRRDRKPIMERR